MISLCVFVPRSTLHASHLPSETALVKEIDDLEKNIAGQSGLLPLLGHHAITPKTAPQLWKMVDDLAHAYTIKTPACSLFVGNFLQTQPPLRLLVLVTLGSLCLTLITKKIVNRTVDCLSHTLMLSRDNASYLTAAALSSVGLFVCLPLLRLLIAQKNNAAAMSLLPCCGHVNIGNALCKNLSPDELEGVIAHELAHIKNNDLPKLLLLFFATHLVLDWALEQLNNKTPLRTIQGYSLVKTGVKNAVKNIVSLFIFMGYSRFCERRADHDAALVINDPDSLAQALIKLTGGNEQKVSCFLYPLLSHPLIQERCSLLAQLAKEKQELYARTT